MKNLFALLLVAGMFTFAACSQNKEEQAATTEEQTTTEQTATEQPATEVAATTTDSAAPATPTEEPATK